MNDLMISDGGALTIKETLFSPFPRRNSVGLGGLEKDNESR